MKEVSLHMVLEIFVKVPFFWTSGRKCNFDGCDKPEFFPKLINGWFWSANQVIAELPIWNLLWFVAFFKCWMSSPFFKKGLWLRDGFVASISDNFETLKLCFALYIQVKMPPTNGNQFHDWSHTGG